jgi:hypothetical protein
MSYKINSLFADQESPDLENFRTGVLSSEMLSVEHDMEEDLYPYREESSDDISDSFSREANTGSSWRVDDNENPEPTSLLRDQFNWSETPSQVLEQFQVAVPANTIAQVLSVAMNTKATKANKKSLVNSGISITDISSALARTVDVGVITRVLTTENQRDIKGKYILEGNGAIDAVFTEAVHQFQTLNYLNPIEHDGVAGRSVLETLGFFNHKLKGSLNTVSFYGQIQLNVIKDMVARDTKKEFMATNWFNGLVKPSWLGVKINDGIHILLLRKLKEAEAWLLAQPKYAGMSPVALGTAMGLKATSRYSGARLSSEGMGMHSFGLALDIDVDGNPWIGAGWIKNDPVKKMERKKFLETLRKASGEHLPGATIFSYLDSIASSSGGDTENVFRILKEKNDQFVDYLRTHNDELKYWTNSATFQRQSPLKGFMSLNQDLVYALRQVAGLAWGALDFGPRASGDMMHFDMRTVGVGKTIAAQIQAHVPVIGHPTLNKESIADVAGEQEEWQNDYALEYVDDADHHEAVEELNWDDDV